MATLLKTSLMERDKSVEKQIFTYTYDIEKYLLMKNFPLLFMHI